MAKRLLWACLLLAVLTHAAWAQTAPHDVLGYQDSNGIWHAYDTTGAGIPTTGGGGPAIKGFGTLAATNTSTLLSTLTVGPNSAVWPTSPGQVYVINSSASAGVVYLCPLGGTCSATVGIPIPAGSAYCVYQGSTLMTVFAASTATVVAQW